MNEEILGKTNARSISGCRVLLVEDDNFIAFELLERLQDAGAIVLGVAPSVELALDTLRTLDQPPHVVSLDFQLIDGTSLKIAEQLERLNIPFLFATGAPQLIPEPYRTHPVCLKPFLLHVWLNALAEIAEPYGGDESQANVFDTP